MPLELPCQIAPTRDFCAVLFECKVKATIKNLGDMIAWPSDNQVVGPKALKAKETLLRFIPHMLPRGKHEDSLYRLVLEHGDFGIHNLAIVPEPDGQHVSINCLHY